MVVSPIGRFFSNRAAVVSPLITMVVGGVLFLWWDHWFVNWDGGFYLYLAKTLREGHGLLFPDGSWATFRGPGYPGLFALGWLVVDMSAKTAIWMSRAVLLVGAALVSWIVGSTTRYFPAAAMAGLAAVVSPLVLHSGASFFVPDGLAVTLTLAAVGLFITGRWPLRLARPLVAGLLFAAAVLTKETALLSFPIFPLVLWVRRGVVDSDVIRATGVFTLASFGPVGLWLVLLASIGSGNAQPSPVPLPGAFAVLAAVAATAVIGIFRAQRVATRWEAPRRIRFWSLIGAALVLISFLSVVFFGEPTIYATETVFSHFADAMAALYGWAWVPAALLLIGAWIAGRGLSGPFAALWAGGLGMFAVGLGLAGYAALAGLGLRNGFVGVYGFALLTGVFVAEVAQRSIRHRVLSLLAVTTLSVAFILLAGMSSNRIDERFADRFADSSLSWDNPAVRETEQWLSESALEEIVTTPSFATYIWFLGDGLPQPTLLPMHFAPSNRPSYSPEDFCRTVWWAGEVVTCPSTTIARAVQGNSRVVAAVFSDAFKATGRKPTLLVTGNTKTTSAFDGAGILYAIEQLSLGEVVYASSQLDLPNWAVVYQVDAAKWAQSGLPTIVMPGFSMNAPGSGGQMILDRARFLDVIHDVLRP